MSEVGLDRNCTRAGEEEVEGEEKSNLIVGYAFMAANGPKSSEQALNGTQRKEWTDAINSELQFAEENNTWSVIPTSDDMNHNLQTIPSPGVLQEKLGKHRRVSR